jgi:hypothetical protein
VFSAAGAISLAAVSGRLHPHQSTQCDISSISRSSTRFAGSRDLPGTRGPKGPNRGIETHLVSGHVVDGVIGLIKQLRADLLVVGFMGHSQLYERIIGGTTDRLVRWRPARCWW